MGQLRGGAYDITDKGLLIIMVDLSISRVVVIGNGSFWHSGIRAKASFGTMLLKEWYKRDALWKSRYLLFHTSN